MSTQQIDFTAGTDSHPNDPHVATPGRVRQVAVPPVARTLSTLSQIDDADAFLVKPARLRTGRASNGPGRSWKTVRSPCDALLWLLSALGLQLGPIRSDGFVVGWEVRRSTPEFVLLGASGPRIGLSAELLLKRQQHTLLWATFVQQDNQMARAVWAGPAPVHRPVVRYVLERASRRIREKERDR